MRRGGSGTSASVSCSRAARALESSLARRAAAHRDAAATSTSARSISASLHQVVHAQLGVALPRPLLAEVHQASGGNPFYALEIVRTLTRSGVSVEAGQAVARARLAARPRPRSPARAAAREPGLPDRRRRARAPDDLDHRDRVRRGTRRRPHRRRSRRASSRPTATESASRTRCSPPAPWRRRIRERRAEIHARLAELLEDPEARAWQLAASVDAPDEGVARVTRGGARSHARQRGAPRPAALLLDRAQQLTPADQSRGRGPAGRRGGALLHFESGDSRRARAQLATSSRRFRPGRTGRARSCVLARVRLYERPDEARELFARVIDEAGDDRHTLGRRA